MCEVCDLTDMKNPNRQALDLNPYPSGEWVVVINDWYISHLLKPHPDLHTFPVLK